MSEISRDLYGNPITSESLPKEDGRWSPNRKAIVIRAVAIDLLSLDEALARYSLSLEEFQAWQKRLAAHGIDGLKTTRIKRFRRVTTH